MSADWKIWCIFFEVQLVDGTALSSVELISNPYHKNIW